MRSRMKRNKNNLKPISMSERDAKLLNALADFRMLSTEQVFRLFFPSIHRTRKRLFQLWQHRYVNRTTRPVRLGEGSSEFLYALTPKGARFLGPDLLDCPTRTRYSRDVSEHSERINDFRICLQLIAWREARLRFDWRQGRELKMTVAIKGVSRLRSVPIIPDAFFSIQSENRDFSYFLEIDRGTTDLRRVTTKIQGYLQLWNEKIPHGKFNIRSFRVLLVTTSAKRLAHMLDSLKHIHRHHARLYLIMFTTLADYSIAEPQRLFEPIWQSLRTEGNVSACSMLPTPSIRRSPQRQENHPCDVQKPDASSKVSLGPADEDCPRLPGRRSVTDQSILYDTVL